jgi:hypothetical protein
MFNIKVLATCFGYDKPTSCQVYIHLVDLHHQYVRAIGSHVVLQYFGNIHNEFPTALQIRR